MAKQRHREFYLKLLQAQGHQNSTEEDQNKPELKHICDTMLIFRMRGG
jgi:hypothetical protein